MKPEDLAGLVSKTIVVLMLGVGVNSVSNLSEKLSQLNSTIIELNGRVLILSEKQDAINRFLQSQIDDLKKENEYRRK